MTPQSNAAKTSEKCAACEVLVPHDKAVLIAPNKRVQKDWQKRYPDIEVILVKDHKGYDLPKGYEQVSDLVVKSVNANTDIANPPSDPKRKANT